MRDLQLVLFEVVFQLNRVYGRVGEFAGNVELALIDPATGVAVKRFATFDSDDIASFDIADLPVTDCMSLLYDYAVEGRLDKRLSDAWEVIYEDFESFFRGLERFPLIDMNAQSFPIDSCLALFDLVHARKMLDYGGAVFGNEAGVSLGHMQLKEVALLAGIDEKTARNLANPKATNRLVTTNWEGRALVEISFARKWLAKRGFEETVEFDSTLDRDLSKQGFWSMQALADFVRGHRERLGLTVEAVAEHANLGADGVSWIRALEAGNSAFDRHRFVELARALNIPPGPFALAVLKQIQSADLERLKSELASNPPTITN